MLNILKNKKVLLLIIGIILIPFIIPIIEILVDSLFYAGKYVGTWIRNLIEVGIC